MVHALATGPLLALAAPLVGWRLYKRVHRNITRQPVQPRRLTFRGWFVALVLGILVFWPAFEPSVALAMLVGTGAGVGMALYGLKLTRFEHTEQGEFYTPNLYIGLTISLLFVLRMGWRLYAIWPQLESLKSGTAGVMAVYARNPLTYGMLAVVLGYFAVYYLGIVRKSRALAPPPAPATPVMPA